MTSAGAWASHSRAHQNHAYYEGAGKSETVAWGSNLLAPRRPSDIPKPS